MSFELLLIPLILVFSFFLIRANFDHAVKLLLLVSIFIHKEVFSIYMWNVLPVRIFMIAFIFYAFYEFGIRFFNKSSREQLLEKSKEIISDPFVTALVVLLIVRTISIIYSRNIQSSVFLLSFFATMVVMGIVFFIKFKDDPNRVLSYIKYYIWAALVASIFGVFQIALFYTTGITIGALWSIPGNIPRVGSVFWDVNHFGAFLASLLPVLGVLILIVSKWKTRIIYSLSFLFMTGMLLLTNSRTAWIAAFISFITFLVLMLFRKYRFKGIAGVVIALILISIPVIREYNIKSSPFRAKVRDYFHYRIDSFDSHLLLLRGSVEIFEDLPILGGGYGGFFEHFIQTDVASVYLARDPAGLNTRVPAHTIWGELISETGILGLVSYIFLMFVILSTLVYAALKLTHKKDYMITAAMASSILGLMVAGIFYSYNSEFFWIVMFLYFIYGVSVLKDQYDFEQISAFFLRSNALPLFVVTSISFILMFSTLGRNHLIPWDEAIYAKIAKNILESGNWMELYWKQGSSWFEKPPFYIWSMAFFMKTLGISELAARLPSAIAGFSTVLLTFFFGKRLYNKTVGLLSAFILLTTTQYLYYSRAAMLDVTVTFFITLALYFYYRAKTEHGYKNWMVSGAAIGFAIMTKGVVGLLPFLVISVYEIILFILKDQKLSKNLIYKYISLFISSCFIFLPWHLYMFYLYGHLFTDEYLGYHVLQRATVSIEDKGRPFYWYIIVLKVSMRIWFVALLAAFPISLLSISKKFRELINTYTRYHFYSYKKDLFIVVYSLAIFLFFSSATSKLVWYIIPLYPALSIMVAVFFERIIRAISPKSLLHKALMIYAIIIFGLLYLFMNKKLVYTDDLTYKQATLIEKKDEIFGKDTKVLADRIELPLMLYYSDGPFEIVDFGPLKEKLFLLGPDQSLVFITKESRYRKLLDTYPDLRLEERLDEWVLVYKPSLEESQRFELERLEKNLEEIEKKISKLKLEDREVDPELYDLLDQAYIELNDERVRQGLPVSP